jgi:phytoene dehydrogenase-like protein
MPAPGTGSPPGPYDAIVIGAGLSGLAAGIRLAQFDLAVVVLERHSLWGGLNSFYKKDGHRFDTGLHALTNFARRGQRGRPLTRVLRQLRLGWERLELQEQRESRVVFPDVQLRFSNDFELLRAEVQAAFPAEAEGFDRLARDLAETGYAQVQEPRPAREVLASYLADPLLTDLLLHPILWYGSPTPDDVQWPVFVVMWKSLYEEGFSRPAGGIRPLLDLLRGRLAELGGELRLRAGVSQIVRDGGRTVGVRLEDGSELSAPRIFSSAGFVESMNLAGEQGHEHEAGRMSFVETCSVLDATPADLGWDSTITFYNLAPRTVYGVPEQAVDARSGVLCCPTNYQGNEQDAPHWRVTVLANADTWKGLPDGSYALEKQRSAAQALDAVASFGADVRGHVTYQDVFTPRTIERFTGHLGGAVYGAPRKRWDGRTHIPGLFLIGTDQGNYGIVGAMMSGIDGANRHALAEAVR